MRVRQQRLIMRQALIIIRICLVYLSTVCTMSGIFLEMVIPDMVQTLRDKVSRAPALNGFRLMVTHNITVLRFYGKGCRDDKGAKKTGGLKGSTS